MAINVKRESSSVSGIVMTQTQPHGSVAAAISFTTPDCSPHSLRNENGAAFDENMSQVSHSKGNSDKSIRQKGSKKISKVTPPEKNEAQKVSVEIRRGIESAVETSTTETSLKHLLEGSIQEQVAANTKNTSDKTATENSRCQTRSSRGFVSRRGGRNGAPSPLRPPMNSFPESAASASETRNNHLKQEYSGSETSLPQDTPRLSSKETSSRTSASSPELSRTPNPYINHTFPLSSSTSVSIKNDTRIKIEEKVENCEADSSSRTKVKNSNASYSPVPPIQNNRTPIRSPPARQRFADLPLDMKLESPGMLSPYFPSIPLQSEPLSAASETQLVSQKDRVGGVTPTNFATSTDFGKGELGSPSFDGSNIPWLSSPNYHLFSPGVMGNTPRGMFGIPRTPRTPTNNPFFSNDIDDNLSTLNHNLVSKKNPGSGLNNAMEICVSPLTKRNPVNGVRVSAGNPILDNINFKEIFASPKASREQEAPAPPDKKFADNGKMTFEKHPAVEREIMEDEDLKLLLQLAQPTPRKNQTNNSCVFRSPRQKTKFGLRHQVEPLSSLQLPFMGRNRRDPSPSKLSRKSPSRERAPMQADDFTPPHLVLGPQSSFSRGIKTSRNMDVITSKGEIKIDGSLKMTKKKVKAKSPLRKPSAASSSLTKTSLPLPAVPRAGPVAGIYTAPGHPQYNHQIPSLHQPPPPPYPTRPHAMQMHRPGMPGHAPFHFPYAPCHPPNPYSYMSAPIPGGAKATKNTSKKGKKEKQNKTALKRSIGVPGSTINKKMKKASSGKVRGGGKKCAKNSVSPSISNPTERRKSAVKIELMNAATGHRNDKAASLAASIMRGVTMRPSGKWQAQLYYAGKSRYIGVFDTREKAALAYEIAREKLKTDKSPSDQSAQSVKETEANVNAARKAAFEGVNEKDPRITGK